MAFERAPQPGIKEPAFTGRNNGTAGLIKNGFFTDLPRSVKEQLGMVSREAAKEEEREEVGREGLSREVAKGEEREEVGREGLSREVAKDEEVDREVAKGEEREEVGREVAKEEERETAGEVVEPIARKEAPQAPVRFSHEAVVSYDARGKKTIEALPVGLDGVQRYRVTRDVRPEARNPPEISREEAKEEGREEEGGVELPMQAKLRVSSPDDPAEREADAMADRVMAMPVQREVVGREVAKVEEREEVGREFAKDEEREEVGREASEEELQTQCADCEAEEKGTLSREEVQREVAKSEEREGEEEVVSAKLQRKGDMSGATVDAGTAAQINSVRNSGGQPLAKSDREFFEERMDADFSNVRVHTNAAANETASAVQARAFTLGGDIVFNQGEYRPETSDGKRLLAHELTHTIQQGAAVSRSVRRKYQGAARSLLQRQSHRAGRELDWTEKFDRLVKTARASIAYAPAILQEAWAHVKEHWLAFTLTAIAVLSAEAVVFALGAAPTGISQVISVVLQSVLLAFFVYVAAVETTSAMDEGMHWYDLATDAQSDAADHAEASRAFCRMLGHMILLVLALAGVRRGGVRLGTTVRRPPSGRRPRMRTRPTPEQQPVTRPPRAPEATRDTRPPRRESRTPPRFDVRTLTLAQLRRMKVADIVGETAEYANNQNAVSARLVLLYATRMAAGERPPPITIRPAVEGTRWVIADGHHRYVAAKLAGVPIEVRVGQGPRLTPFFWSRVTWTLKD